ncbi:hypothetical protein CALVIDRAFT_538032 [Calocera viscosa TUFC12733]|uniref:Uncharacterized protein n=1 Tax=Calocera viscosa (strain TUFC12733) TaxID=1330018 RepID=A0A167LFC2_CALVF|nr:hypothetical protein CALVIDRAFT_538032 [Calocera viscosa TUFC12733]
MEKDAREKKEKEQAEARKAYQAYTAQLAAQASAAAQSPTARTPANPYAAYTAAAGAVPISSAEIQRQAQPGDYRAAYLQYAQAWAAYAQAQAQAAQRAGNSSAPAAATHPAGAYALAASPPVPTTPLNAPSSSATIQSPLAATAPITPVATTAPVTPAPPKPPLLSSQPPLTMNQATATAVPTAASAVTSAQTGAAVRTVPTHPIPLQIPSSVLPAFESLGIRPVPSTDAVSTTAGPPAAVLVGSREDGQMLDITINLSLLDSAQLSGLAAVLNIVKTSGVSLQAGALGNAATTSTAPASPDMARAPNGIGQSPLTAASQSPLAGVPSNPLAAYYASYYPYYPMRTPTAAASSVQASTIAHANQTQLSSVLASGEVASPAVEPKTNGT